VIFYTRGSNGVTMRTMPLDPAQLCTAFGTGDEQHIAAMLPFDALVTETLCGREILAYGAQLSPDPSGWPSSPPLCPQCRDIALRS